MLSIKKQHNITVFEKSTRCGMHSFVRYFLLLWIISYNYVDANDFVYEYFHYKNVSRVTIFSCDQTEDDFRFVKKMNELGISVSVTHPNTQFFNVSKQVLRKDIWSFGLLLDTRCQIPEVTEKIIAQTTEYRFYEVIHVWLILGSNLETVTELLDDTEYSIMTDVAIGIETEIGYDLYDIYNPCKIRGGILNITTLGFWNPEIGLNITLAETKIARRSNLFGMKIKVASIVKYKPADMSMENYLQDYTTKSKDPISKYGYSILRAIADLFNFTMEVQVADEWIATINGTEQGMMPMVFRAEADIGGTPASAVIMYAGRPGLRLLMPACPFRTFFIFRSNEEKLKWTELLTPFSIDSWYASVVTGVLSIMIITTIQMTEFGQSWFVEIGHAIFAVLGATCQQGLTFVPNRLAGRTAFLILLLLGVLLSNYYSASVVSVRISQPPEKMNDSLYSLAKSNMTVASESFRNVDFYLDARSLIEWEVRYFKNNVWDKLSPSKYVDPEIGLAKAAQGGYAYHSTPEVAYHYVESHWDDNAICDITEVHVITPRILAFYERANSPFNEIMKIGLLKTQNIGIRKRNIERWRAHIPFCSPDARSVQSVTFLEIAPAVMMISLGIVLASMTLIFEIIVYKLHSASCKVRSLRRKRRSVKKWM